MNAVAGASMGGALTDSPARLTYFNDDAEAFRLIESCRWPHGKYCPRCRSKFTKAVNSAVFRELFRCVDCGYMFNTLSGTMLQGTKLAAVKFLQLFVIYDAADGAVSSRDISYALQVSVKTATALLGRMSGLGVQVKFTSTDLTQWERLALVQAGHGEDRKTRPYAKSEHENFFLYCDMKRIVVDDLAFRSFLVAILSGSRAGANG